MSRQPFPAVTVQCPMCGTDVTPDNPREGQTWAGQPFPVRTHCIDCEDKARLAARCLIAAVHEADDEARQNAA